MSEILTANETKLKKFQGDGIPFKGKLIGMDDLTVDRDEKLCLDSMFKLKAIARARGEHKQKVQLNLTTKSVNIVDDLTKVQLVSHEVERISFVVMDPRDARAFGYIYNTSDDRHQFWAIKTERTSATTVLALKDLFEAVFEQIKNVEKAKTQENQTTSVPISPDDITISTQQPSLQSIPVSVLQPSSEPVPAPTVPQHDGIWGDGPSLTVPLPIQTSQQSAPNVDLWGMSEPIAPVIQPPPRVEDPFADVFGLLAPPPATTTTTQQSVSTNSTGDLFSMFPTPPPVPTVNNNVLIQPTRPAPFFPQQQQPNLPPPATKPIGEFDLLGDFA